MQNFFGATPSEDIPNRPTGAPIFTYLIIYDSHTFIGKTFKAVRRSRPSSA